MTGRDRAQVPARTAAVVRAACPKGTRVTRLRDALGPVFVDDDFADWFATEGRPGLPPGMLALVCVLQAMEDLTDRDAADAVRTRLDWKYALSLDPEHPGFDFSVLSEFRDRLALDRRATSLLDTLLDRARDTGLLKAGARMRTDSTHVLARIRTLNRLEMVGETVRAALDQLAALASGWLPPRISPEWAERYGGRRIDSARLPAGKQARAAWGDQVAADGADLLELVEADQDNAWLAGLPAVATLRAIWEQQCVRERRGRWRLREGRITEGAVHIDSPRDPQARWCQKRDTTWSGYKVHLSETCDDDAPHLIVQAETTVARTTDHGALGAIRDEFARRGLAPGELYLDEGYVTAEAVAAADDDGTEIVGPLTRDSSGQAKAGGGFARDDFAIDWDARTATCPAGRRSAAWHHRGHMAGDGAAIEFAAADCHACPFRTDCTRSVSAGRQLVVPSRRLYEIQRRNRTDQNDPEWRQRYSHRAGVEGALSEAARAYGVRRCRYLGLGKTRVQHQLAACGMNAARIADWIERDSQPAPARSQTRFAALCATATQS
ncbi:MULTISPECIES: IS1182 family transposase [unclassified Frankia]|uniref:IS1182 family transposase n=1 Tax=unclassified Frankia TaxID=2632575 RepID=UPI001EF6CF55|nr:MULTISPECIES: IS1182 family transposase [unclassified Frankia]